LSYSHNIPFLLLNSSVRLPDNWQAPKQRRRSRAAISKRSFLVVEHLEEVHEEIFRELHASAFFGQLAPRLP
jgi:hypothetical protein